MKDIQIKKWKDFPQEGVTFIDINNIIQDPLTLAELIYRMTVPIERCIPTGTIIVSPESRAHLFSSIIAYKLRLPLINLRKKGKYPEGKCDEIKYNTEYQTGSIYAPKYDYKDVQQIYVIDDLCATGQSYQGIKEYYNKIVPNAEVSYITAIDLEYLHQPIMNHTSILKIKSPDQEFFNA